MRARRSAGNACAVGSRATADLLPGHELKFAPSIGVRTQPANAACVTVILQSDEMTTQASHSLAHGILLLPLSHRAISARPTKLRMVRPKHRFARAEAAARCAMCGGI
jgi:hypothetical protein